MLRITVLALFVGTFLVQPSRIPSASMQPTLDVGDFLLIDKQSYSPAPGLDWALPPKAIHRGDVAVFHFPPDPAIPFVKRIVAIPGDSVHLRAGVVSINGSETAEPYTLFEPAAADTFRDDFPSLLRLDPDVEPAWWATLRRSTTGGEIVLPRGDYFALGDNRNDSLDSRYWGYVGSEAFVGRAFLVVLRVPAGGGGSRMHGLLHSLRHALRVVR